MSDYIRLGGKKYPLSEWIQKTDWLWYRVIGSGNDDGLYYIGIGQYGAGGWNYRSGSPGRLALTLYDKMYSPRRTYPNVEDAKRHLDRFVDQVNRLAAFL